VLRACGRAGESQRAVEAGLAVYEKKGNTPGAARARGLLGDRAGGV